VIYSAAAVAVAIGLAISITFAFPSPAAPDRFSSGSCPSTGLPKSGPFPTSTLTPNGTVTVNDTTYWYVTIIPNTSLTGESFRFQGVNFSMGSASSDILVSGVKWTTSNATVLLTLVNGNPSCWFFLPWFGISFSDGTTVVYNSYTASVNAGGTQGNLTFNNAPASNPWFTQHTGPQAGVGYQTDGGEITLYVSVT
jgi:hypothetical protein